MNDTNAKTLENLKEAFAGESQANRKYLAFAKKAEEEGYVQIARLFKAAAEAETVHAHAHLRAMDGVKSTRENLQSAISGETFEFENMYPQMIDQAEKDGEDEARISFMNANAVEEIHAGLYQKYLDNMDNLEDKDIFVCEVCGNTVEGEPPDVCPICGSPRSKFKKID
jgi:rubrerythrin